MADNFTPQQIAKPGGANGIWASLQEELADADGRLQVSLGESGGFSTFADDFFDGLSADWVVQSKVQKASGACSSAIGDVASALAECRRRLSETEQEISRVDSERRAFSEQA